MKDARTSGLVMRRRRRQRGATSAASSAIGNVVSPAGVCSFTDLGLFTSALLTAGILFLAGVASPPSAAVLAQEKQEKTEAATVQYNAAVGLQNRGEYELAAGEWETFLKRFGNDPRCDRAHHYLGVCYLKLNRFEQAAQSFQTVIDKFPKSELIEATWLYLGIAQYSIGQAKDAQAYDTAAATFQTLVAKHPKSKHIPQALFYAGEALYARGKKREAGEMYARLVNEFPGDANAADALYALGVCHEELQDYPSAGKCYDMFLEKFPNHQLATEVTMRKGETLFQAGQYQEAADRFAVAASKADFPLADHALFRQAAALASLKRYEEAASLYASLPAKHPQSKYSQAAALAAGRLFHLANKHDQAIKLLKPLAEGQAEGAIEAAHWLARSLLALGKPQDALAAVEKVLPQASESKLLPQLLLDRADAVYEIPQRRPEAAVLYAQIAEKYPNDPTAPQALYLAGFAALGQNDFDAALKYAGSFLSAHGSHELAPDVKFIAAESNLQKKQYAEARKLFAELVQKHPQHADAQTWKVRLALTLFLEKQYAEAAKFLQAELKNFTSPQIEAEAQLLLGNTLLELGQAEEAVQALEASVAATAEWRQADEALLSLAQALIQVKQPAKARQTLRSLVSKFPQSKLLDRAHYRLGELLTAEGDFKAAAAEYQQVADRWPDSPLAPYAWYGLGSAKLKMNDYGGAEKAFDQLLAKAADARLASAARLARAGARERLQKYQEAIADLNAFLSEEQSAQGKTEARYLLAVCQAALKQNAEAVATLEGLLKDDPQPAIADKVYYELGWALKSLGKEQQAVEAFGKLVKLAPDSPLAAEALYHVAEWSYQNKDYKQAAEGYRQSMQRAGKSELGEKAAHKLGWAYFWLQQFDEAQKTFAAQRAAWPRGPLADDAAFMEGECLFKLKKFKEALAAYNLAKNPTGKDFAVLKLLRAGQAAAQLGQWKASADILARAAKEFPQSAYLPEILYELGWANQKQGNLDQARKLYEQVIASSTSEVAARAQYMIGSIEFEQQKHADAIKSYFKVIYGYSFPTWQAEAMYEAARCFEILGKQSQAIKQYQELVEKFPDSDKTPLAKERLKVLKN